MYFFPSHFLPCAGFFLSHKMEAKKATGQSICDSIVIFTVTNECRSIFFPYAVFFFDNAQFFLHTKIYSMPLVISISWEYLKSMYRCMFKCPMHNVTFRVSNWKNDMPRSFFDNQIAGGDSQIGHFSNPHRVACLWADSNSGSVQTGHAWSSRAKCRGDPFLTSAPSRSRCRCPRRSSAIGIRASFSSIPQISFASAGDRRLKLLHWSILSLPPLSWPSNDLQCTVTHRD